MGKKRTSLELIHRAEDLLEELDGLVWECTRVEELRRKVFVPDKQKVTRSQVKKIQTKCNELWRALQSYKDSL